MKNALENFPYSQSVPSVVTRLLRRFLFHHRGDGFSEHIAAFRAEKTFAGFIEKKILKVRPPTVPVRKRPPHHEQDNQYHTRPTRELRKEEEGRRKRASKQARTSQSRSQPSSERATSFATESKIGKNYVLRLSFFFLLQSHCKLLAVYKISVVSWSVDRRSSSMFCTGCRFLATPHSLTDANTRKDGVRWCASL